MLLGASAPSSAWGESAHRIIGEIAWAELSQEARECLVPLMPDPGFRTLATTGFWADRVARRNPEFDWARPLHYVNVKPDASRYSARRDCRKNRCVVAAVERFRSEFAAPDSSHAERIQALRWLSHFVADLHQPLHVAHPDDRGGNKTFVTFFGENKKLHWIWDTGLIQKLRGDRANAAYAQNLRESIRSSDRKSWRKGGAERWANESLRLAQRYTYDVTDNDFFDPSVTEALRPVVELQLKRAAIRLAHLLERHACAASD